MPSKVNLIGKVFGRWTVLREDEKRGNGGFIKWICKCDCGNECSVFGTALKNGTSKSCGCYRDDRAKEVHTTHGQSKIDGRTREYGVWSQIKQRCRNKHCESYPEYGGIGVIICDRWADSFENFFLDMGECPSPIHSADRYPNRHGNYEPGNCRWATPRQQLENRDCSVWLTYNGITMLMADWSRKLKIHHDSIRYHLSKGKSFDEIISYFLNKKSISASDIC